jgi:hypothetical protein
MEKTADGNFKFSPIEKKKISIKKERGWWSLMWSLCTENWWRKKNWRA